MSEMKTYSKGIFSSDHQEEREHIVELLKQAYWMEVETVINYITTSVNVDGLRAQEIRESPAKDVQEELGHAQQFADRIKKLYGVVQDPQRSSRSRATCSRPNIRPTSST